MVKLKVSCHLPSTNCASEPPHGDVEDGKVWKEKRRRRRVVLLSAT